ncbi:hypothetical protein V8N76_004573 [Salmonella enterica]
MTPEEKAALKEKARRKAAKAKEQIKTAKAIAAMPTVDMPEVTGDIEADTKADLDAMQQAFRDSLKREDKRFELATDTEFWVAVCFQTREQKEVFLRALAMIEEGDKYIDGQRLAERLNIPLPEGNVPYKPDGKVIKTWLEFTDK